MTFSGIRLVEKTGGRSGTYRAADACAWHSSPSLKLWPA